jgi:HK97 family phage portal protein
VGLIDNIRASAHEQRAIGGVPWQPWNSFSSGGYFSAGGPAHPTREYYGPQAAMGLPALYAGVKLLADSAASLPLRVYQNLDGTGSSGFGYGSHRRYMGPTIFDRPSVIGTFFDWMSQAMVAVLLQGNAWGFITGKDGYGFPTGIEWIPPEDVYVLEPQDMQTANPLRAKVFVYGREVTWYGPDAEVFHVRGITLPGRVEALSPLRNFALTITAGNEAQRYGTSWYESGGFPPGTFQNAEMEVNAAQAAEIRAELVKSLRRREPLVYGRDWDYKPVTVPPSEAQFIEAMQLNATQIAAILNLPPDRLGGSRGDSLTYSTAEQSTLQIIEALRPWLVRFEQSFFDLLPRNRFTRFWTDALLKTDIEARMNSYQTMRNIGIRTADEIRELEDLPPLANGIGAEEMPLTTMNAMATRAGAIPKSFLKSVVLEMDVATDRLIKLEKTYIAQGRLPQAAPPAAGAGGAAPGGAQRTDNGEYGNGSGEGSGPGSNSGAGGGAAAGSPGAGGPVPVTGPQPPAGTAPIGLPNAPLPLAQDPASFLASLISVQRNMAYDYEDREAARAIYARIVERAQRIEAAEPEARIPASHMLAPWVPGRNDLREIVLSANGHKK